MLRTILLLTLCFRSAAFAAELPHGEIPSPRTQEFAWMSIAAWQRLHAEDVLVADHDQVGVLFLGDSITAGWDWELWQKHFVPLKAANFAVGGDHTGNVLWRLQHGAVGELQPKLVVILIGVNNLTTLQETPAQASAGVTRVVQQVQLAWPQSPILLLGVLPFGERSDSPGRKQVRQLNARLAQMANGENIVFKDYGPLLLADGGNISADIMADFLHPTRKGYEILAAAMLPVMRDLLRVKNED